MSPEHGIYTPLPPDESSIRLLTLLPGPFDDEITCILEVHSISGDYEYEALSYTWGDANGLRPILVNGIHINVTANLKVALQYLRRRSEPRVIWIDAVCINQNDNQEKLLQIQRMGGIFSSAAYVIAWLGESTPDVDQVWSAMARIGEVIWTARVSGGHNLPDTDFAPGLASPDDLRQKGVDVDAIDWTTIWELCERPFWHRVWIIQELVLASNFWDDPTKGCVVGCGSNWMPLISFIGFQSLFGTTRVYQGRINGLSFATLRTLLETRGSPAAERMFEVVLSLSVGSSDDAKLSTQRSLSHLLRLARGFQATDPRDKLYAFLGIADNPFTTPDYTLSVENVFKNWVRGCIQQDRNLDCLHGNRTSINQSGPSWLPELSGSTKEGFSFMEERIRYARCSNERDYRVHAEVAFIEGGNVLKARGVSLGIVERVVGPFSRLSGPEGAPTIAQDDSQLTQPKTSLQELQELMRLYLSLPEHAQEETWRALVMDKDTSNGREPVSPAPDNFRRLWHTLMAICGVTEAPGSWSMEDLAGIDQLMASLATAIFMDRCFFATRDLVFGLGSFTTQPGDEVVMLRGSPLCFVLRPVGERYQLVGDAYVQGVNPASFSNRHGSTSEVKDFMIA
ncbi:hypothetical protein NW759_008674 [Fusarium solani]|uniref:Heterokaryon incompatibility protein-domain-containing protein n=1 Tax=Fusarium solani TaxID=169388 RepID=A0A9P9K0E8_FUSSL|nr:heterokaryon incompatibility protein-domain-containing protein [Fusarium solani]KAH7239711.1 heterokaryon incompatibility protein-domain-containing protein [Fusarium solani]KAJ4218079.1 hypothetical protein NW759_008674 [Fusarium solani]